LRKTEQRPGQRAALADVVAGDLADRGLGIADRRLVVLDRQRHPQPHRGQPGQPPDPQRVAPAVSSSAWTGAPVAAERLRV
jgi:hypothetical protein